MQRGFTKLFNTIVTSTIWQEDDKTRIVWITMLAIADAAGIVSASIPGLASVANVDTDAARSAVAKLQDVDPDSRTKDFDGRRIEAIDGGWHILNYAKYRRMLSEDERREYKAKWIAEKRRQVSTVDKCRKKSSLSTQAEAEAEAEAEKRKRKPLSLSDCVAYAKTIEISEPDAEAFFDSQEAGGWTRNGKALKNWQAAIRTWKANGWLPSQKQNNQRQFTRPKEKAPVYPKMSEGHEVSDEEFENARRIAREETARLKEQFK